MSVGPMKNISKKKEIISVLSVVCELIPILNLLLELREDVLQKTLVLKIPFEFCGKLRLYISDPPSLGSRRPIVPIGSDPSCMLGLVITTKPRMWMIPSRD
jgi:hypothetical protein